MIRDKKPCCDMNQDCDQLIKYVDSKGFIYCENHGLRRKLYTNCRKLKTSEIKDILKRAKGEL